MTNAEVLHQVLYGSIPFYNRDFEQEAMLWMENFNEYDDECSCNPIHFGYALVMLPKSART